MADLQPPPDDQSWIEYETGGWSPIALIVGSVIALLAAIVALGFLVVVLAS